MTLETIVFYVSGHGFGHASRCIEVINALLARAPGTRVIVRTTAARWLFDHTMAGPFEYHAVETDTGVVQIDSLRLDETETLTRARAFLRDFDARADAEAAFLRQADAQLAVADTPPLGLAAASRAAIPAIAFGNFTWDWIYGAYAGSDDIVAACADAYACADLALRLPMHGGFATCRRVIDVPFVARRSQRLPADTRARLRLPAEARVVLVSFGGYGLDGLDLDALAALDGHLVLLSVPSDRLSAALRVGRRGSLLPFDARMLDDAGLRYEDLVRAADVVVSKPGYGIIAECLANGTALLYTSRGRFAEYDVLVAALPQLLRSRFIAQPDLFAGRWRRDLDALLQAPRPSHPPQTDGAGAVADMLLAVADGHMPLPRPTTSARA